MCGRRLLRPLRVRQLLRVLSPCCAAAAVAERVTYGCVDIWIRKKYSAQIVSRCVPPRGAAQHQPRGCCAQQLRSNYQADNQAVTSVRTTRLVLRYYQAGNSSGDNPAGSQLPAGQADNPADNPAVSFVVYLPNLPLSVGMDLDT